MRITIAVATGLMLACLAACGSSSRNTPTTTKAVNPNAKEKSPPGDIPDTQVYVPFTLPGQGITVKVPEGWSRITSGKALVFTDNLNSVRIQTQPAAKPLSVSAVKKNQLHELRMTKGFKAGSVSTLARAGGTAIRIRYLAIAPPNAVTGKSVTDAVERYLYVHNGKELILTLSGPQGADNVDPWKLISNSVRWK